MLYTVILYGESQDTKHFLLWSISYLCDCLRSIMLKPENLLIFVPSNQVMENLFSEVEKLDNPTVLPYSRVQGTAFTFSSFLLSIH